MSRAPGLRERLSQLAQEVWSAPRPVELALGLVLLMAALVYLPLRVAVSARDAMPSLALAAVELITPEPPFRTDDVDPEAVLWQPPDTSGSTISYDPGGRNLFAFGTPPPTPPPVRTPYVPPVDRGPSTPTPPPRPPTPPPAPPWSCPLSLLGLARHPDYPIAFFKDQEDAVYAARPGETLVVRRDEKVVARCRLERVEVEEVTLVNPDNPRQSRSLPLRSP